MTETLPYQISIPTADRAPAMLQFHAAQLAELFRTAQVEPGQIEQHMAEMLSSAGVASAQAILERQLQDPGYYVRIVEQDMTIKGVMTAVRSGTVINGRSTPFNEVWNIELAEDLRGHGVADAMIGDFFTRYADGSRFTKASVLMANMRARNYAARWGFEPTDYSGTMTVGSTYARAVIMTRWPDEPVTQ